MVAVGLLLGGVFPLGDIPIAALAWPLHVTAPQSVPVLHDLLHEPTLAVRQVPDDDLRRRVVEFASCGRLSKAGGTSLIVIHLK